MVYNLVNPILQIENSNFSYNMAKDGGALGFIGLGLSDVSKI
jgi:hypothetical protein